MNEQSSSMGPLTPLHFKKRPGYKDLLKMIDDEVSYRRILAELENPEQGTIQPVPEAPSLVSAPMSLIELEVTPHQITEMAQRVTTELISLVSQLGTVQQGMLDGTISLELIQLQLVRAIKISWPTTYYNGKALPPGQVPVVGKGLSPWQGMSISGPSPHVVLQTTDPHTGKVTMGQLYITPTGPAYMLDHNGWTVIQ
jgi:hypothetical protein